MLSAFVTLLESVKIISGSQPLINKTPVSYSIKQGYESSLSIKINNVSISNGFNSK